MDDVCAVWTFMHSIIVNDEDGNYEHWTDIETDISGSTFDDIFIVYQRSLVFWRCWPTAINAFCLFHCIHILTERNVMSLHDANPDR